MPNQMLLTICGLLLLSVLNLTFNTSAGEQQSTMLNNEAVLTSASLAQGMLDEISTRSFDEQTVTKGLNSTDSLTASNLLGPDSGEINVYQYDDIDDFKNYSKVIALERLGNFYMSVDVNYIQNMLPDVKFNLKSFTKRIDVAIFNTYLPDTLKLKTVISY